MPAFECPTIRTSLEGVLHTLILIAPFFITGALHASDSLFTQVPATINVDSNIMEVGFGIRQFSVGNATDIRFSDEQEDALGGHHHVAAHMAYHVFSALLWIFLLVPILTAIKHRWWNKTNTMLVLLKMMKSFAKVYIPLIIFCTLLMAIPFGLLAKSNLCGPHYIELGFQEESSSDDSSSDDFDSDFEGTFATVHDDISATCQLDRSGMGIAVLMAAWPFILLAQAYFLNRRGNELERDIQLAEELKIADATISVSDKNGDEDTIESTNEDGDMKEISV
jgi:spore maturation protein SpmB